MMNLLEETICTLEEQGKTPSDVMWCGTEDFGFFTWDEFAKLADVNYDSGYGGEEVAMDLIIRGKNFWLERHEYDGSEWWEYKSLPKRPKFKRAPQALVLSQSVEIFDFGYHTASSLLRLHEENIY